MINDEKIMDAIYAAIGDVNRTCDYNHQLLPEPETRLCGEGGGLDSMGTINFIVALEKQLKNVCSCDVNLTDEESLLENLEVLFTVKSLNAYLMDIVNGN